MSPEIYNSDGSPINGWCISRLIGGLINGLKDGFDKTNSLEHFFSLISLSQGNLYRTLYRAFIQKIYIELLFSS